MIVRGWYTELYMSQQLDPLTKAKWRELATDRIAAAKRQINQTECLIAAEQMGYALEYGLKAVCCNRLNTSHYPPKFEKPPTQSQSHFRTHEFEVLLILSGLSDIFGSGEKTNAKQNWDYFTGHYTGDWTVKLRYEPEIMASFTKPKVEELYNYLYEHDDSVWKTIETRW